MATAATFDSNLEPITSTEVPAESLTGRLRGSTVIVPEQSNAIIARQSNSTSTNKSLSSIDILLIVQEWMHGQEEAQKSMEKEQESKKEEHWKYVKQRCAKMKELTSASFAASCVGAIALGVGAAIGYKSQSLLPSDPMSTFYSIAGGAAQALGGLPDKWFEGKKSTRDSDAYYLEQMAQRSEKGSQGQSSKVQKSERTEDSAQSFFKQHAQQSGQMNDAINSMLRAH